MSISQAAGSDSTMWKQVYQDALLEFDPIHVRTKLQAAKRAVEERLFEVLSHDGKDRWELMDLKDAQRIILLLERPE
jgi:hypothetical protein